jgi:hypothetical protein
LRNVRWAIGALSVVCLGLAWLVQGAPARVLAQREAAWGTQIEEGDVLFQDLDCGERCQLIREVTRSRYTHVGIVLREHGELMVWEALSSVGPTPLLEWVHRGVRERVALYRFQAPVADHLGDVAREVRAMRGLPYDADYQWDDDRIYCSELIAKAISRALPDDAIAPVVIGALGPHAKRIRTLSGGRLTEATPMVTPVALTRSPLLRRVVDEL